MNSDMSLLGGHISELGSRDDVIMAHDYMGMSSSSSEGSSDPAEADLELGLGLSLGIRSKIPSVRGEFRRFFTAKDLPSTAPANGSSSSSPCRFPTAGAISGTKRPADNPATREVPSPAVSQVVGWPPIGAYRMNNLVNQAKALSSEEDRKVSCHKYEFKDSAKKKQNNGNNSLGFVKVNMDGLPIGRKVDLKAHSCYKSLSQALENMFFRLTPTGEEKEYSRKASELLDGSAEFVLTYEDKDGDWMLVGDLPWEMFLNTVRRLRIMKTSEANGLGPRFEEAVERQRKKPILEI